MNDVAYDISYLLASEPAQARMPVATARASPAPPPPSVAGAQEVLARELMQAADAHEELIRQYLGMAGES